jgi:hypothetical protein
MTREEFTQKYRHNARVYLWLLKNPPPFSWKDSKLDWAYLEMPWWRLWF